MIWEAMDMAFGREVCCDLPSAQKREWLVTNGLGSYACGTVAGLLTRGYHGLLVTALKPPLGQTLQVAKLDETAQYDGRSYPLFANRWIDGVNPEGQVHIEHFGLDGAVPHWRFACADALVAKQIWMQPGANTTYVRYRLLRATQPLTLSLKVLVNYRNHHGRTRAGNWQMDIESVPDGIRVMAFDGAAPFWVRAAGAVFTTSHLWYRQFFLTAEHERGLEPLDDHLCAATVECTLQPGQELTVVASAEPKVNLDGSHGLARRVAYEQNLLDAWKSADPAGGTDPGWVARLVLAADQFIVERPLPGTAPGKTVIAGYPWFSDWGRDTMISLSGLTLVTGRPQVAGAILRTFAPFVSRGMLPNRFPDDGSPLGEGDYNTVDATLWYFEAIRAYTQATGDGRLLGDLFTILAEIVDWYSRGTRFHICQDPHDGLLYAGEAGVQLTWMDAKVGDWVVTPRIGKPIEVNALWYHALCTMADFAHQLGRSASEYEAMAKRTRRGFERFWNPAVGYCFDVLEGPGGDDPALRPNQLLAVSLSNSPLDNERQRALVDVCARTLLAGCGLRSLAPGSLFYQGRYGGDQKSRDGAYHQGTAWGWLLGVFVQAHLRAYGDRAQARGFLEPIADHLRDAGLGTVSEIFDGEAPMIPKGCIAQAWSVAEILCAWRYSR